MRRDGGNYGSWLGWGISIADFLWTYGSEKAWMFMDEHCKDNGVKRWVKLAEKRGQGALLTCKNGEFPIQ